MTNQTLHLGKQNSAFFDEFDKILLWIAICSFLQCPDRICNFNRHFAEYSGYWESTSFLTDVEQNIEDETGEVTFYDSGWKGSPLFTAPRDRSWEEFITESKKHGWPSFRDSEVDWEYARVLPGGEMVSIDGTHLGHNLPDSKGNRYCISKYLDVCLVVNCFTRLCTIDLYAFAFVLILRILFHTYFFYT